MASHWGSEHIGIKRNRTLLNHLSFRVRRFIFLLTEKLRSSHEYTSIAWLTFRNVCGIGIVALLLVSALELVDYLFSHYSAFTDSYHPTWWADANSFVKQALGLDKDTVTSYLNTIAVIAGGLLGVYFAATSIIISSMFNSVSGTIRHQLLREKAGSLYVEVLALLLSASVFLLVYQSIGGMISILNVLFLLSLSLFGVLSFILLGTRVFNFFDLPKLADRVYRDIYRDIRLATIHGFAWDDLHFQSHYQKNASKHLDSLSVFVRTALGVRAREENPLIQIVNRLSRLLTHYQKQKQQIPTRSHWYQLTPSYQNGFLAGSATGTGALNTSAGLQSTAQPDALWFESKVCRIIEEALSNTLNEKEVRTAYRILEPLSSTLKFYGEELALPEAEKLLTILRTRVTTFVGTYKGEATQNAELGIYCQALVDLHGYCAHNFVVSILMTGTSFELRRFERHMGKVSWRNPESIYRSRFPSSMLARLEHVGETVLFERRVEGEIISPAWYRNQLVAMQYLELLANGLMTAVRLIGEEFSGVAAKYLSEKKPLFAASHAHRGLEACEKLNVQFPEIRNKVSTFESVMILHDLPWTKWDWSELDSQLKGHRSKLIEIVAHCLDGLSDVERRKVSPDLFGQSYKTVYAQAIFALRENDANEFGLMFPHLFEVGIEAAEKLKKEDDFLPGTAIEQKLIVKTEPIIDILELSGYAMIYSELLHNAALWTVCQKKWDEYLNMVVDTAGVVGFFLRVFNCRETLGKVVPKDGLRTDLGITLNAELRKRNLIRSPGTPEYYTNDQNPAHRSAFIRALCTGMREPSISAAELFFLKYLKQRPGTKSVQFEDRYDFLEHLYEETKKEEVINFSKEKLQ